MIKKFSPRTILKFIKYWPPYWGARVSVESIDKDFHQIRVKMPLTFMNTNYVGCHFGGSLYSMCDPFFMFILLHHLGKEHVVWDQSAKIDFIKPGKETVYADFFISEETIEELRHQALESFSIKPIFHTQVIDSSGEIVANVEKQLYIRRKDAKERFKN